jgi:hypothetical protein
LILAEAEALLARCLDEQDYDLAGEVLLSWPLTGKAWSAAAAFAFRVIAHVEDKAGFLPTAATRISEIRERDGIERKKYLLATAYHTGYVMGLVCAACLRPGYAPPTAIPVSNAEKPDRAGTILKALDSDGKHPHWRDDFNQLAATETDALAGFLLDIALRRRVAIRDFGGIHDLLRLAYDLDLADTPAASQAAELLQRLAAYSKIETGPDSQLAALHGFGSTATLPVSPASGQQDRSPAA